MAARSAACLRCEEQQNASPLTGRNPDLQYRPSALDDARGSGVRLGAVLAGRRRNRVGTLHGISSSVFPPIPLLRVCYSDLLSRCDCHGFPAAVPLKYHFPFFFATQASWR